MTACNSTHLSISFGSCFGLQDSTNDIFQTIGSSHLDIFSWGGDAFYTDHVGTIVTGDYTASDAYILDKYKNTRFPFYEEMK